MNPTDLKLNTYVPAEWSRFASPISLDRRHFLARTFSFAIRIGGNADLMGEYSKLNSDAGSSQNETLEYVPSDDLTPLEKAARRLMIIASCAKDGYHKNFTEEEIIALAFDAGCEITEIEDAYGAALLPINMIRVERRTDGLIAVYEEGVEDGIVLYREKICS